MSDKIHKLKMCVLGAATSPHVITRTLIFCRLGYDVTLVSPVPYHGVDLDIKIVWPNLPEKQGFFSNVITIIRTLKLVRQQVADIYFAHYAAEITTWAAALTFRKFLVVNVMGGDVLSEQHEERSLINRLLTTFVLRRADLVTVKSTQLNKLVSKLGVSPDRIMNIYWGVDRNVFHRRSSFRSAVRNAWGVGVCDHVIFSPRILQPMYNQDAMIKAMPEILKCHPTAVLVISMFEAAEEYLSELRSQVNAMGVSDRVIFVPGMANDEMVKAYSASDIVLSIPCSDGFPQTIFEAMACEVPVIISNLDHYKDLVTNKENVVMINVTSVDIVNAVSALLNDDAFKNKLISNGKKVVSEYADLNVQALRVSDRLQALVRRASVY